MRATLLPSSVYAYTFIRYSMHILCRDFMRHSDLDTDLLTLKKYRWLLLLWTSCAAQLNGSVSNGRKLKRPNAQKANSGQTLTSILTLFLILTRLTLTLNLNVYVSYVSL